MKTAIVSAALLKTLRPEIDAALAAIAKKHGLGSLTAGKATYDPTAGHFAITINGVAKDGVDKDAARYQSAIAMLGLPPLGSTFKAGTNTYTITGINTTGSKVHVTRQDGQKYLYGTDAAIALCARKR